MIGSDVVPYRAPATRSFTALWMLEELGLAYRSVIVPMKDRPADYLAVNPSGMVPSIVDRGAVVSECPAICLYLADRFSYGDLAPRIEERERGAYLAWMVFATAQREPARAVRDLAVPIKPGNWGMGWRDLDGVVKVLADALSPGPFLLGERFTAADVMIGSTLAMGLHTQELPAHPVLASYNERLAARPACRKASAINWGGG
jgi:glutathione S-transferase